MADSKQTLLCTYLSGVLLLGLVLNSLFGWSWADPLVALVIAAVAVKEGREAWRATVITRLLRQMLVELRHADGGPATFSGISSGPGESGSPVWTEVV